jgi:hypothetical protein
MWDKITSSPGRKHEINQIKNIDSIEEEQENPMEHFSVPRSSGPRTERGRQMSSFGSMIIGTPGYPQPT